MLPILPLLLVAAAPVHVLALHVPAEAEHVAEWKRLTKPGAVVSLPELHEYLLRSGHLTGAQDFAKFTASPVPGWPKALEQTWTEGLRVCASLVTELNSRTYALTLDCAQRLSRYLWKKAVDFHAAERVVELYTSGPTVTDRTVLVVGTSWNPATREERIVQRGTSPEKVRQVVNEVLATLASGGGEVRAREVVNEMETPASGDPFAGEEKVLTPLVLKTSCPTLPTKLEFANKGVLEEVLGARWAPQGATGAPASCKLSSSTHEEPMMGVQMQVLMLALDCGGPVTRAEVPVTPMGKKPKTELASERLLQLFAAQRCR